ncbi:hypothetical protein QUF64_15370 [Anaerolineales bacterium HSG6]|nr:hypothetical protein [Anaerolineales bacterium HSG6]MDM8530897.1 hypothetical protein [Anaerolineales bacterium HSG25]
MTNATPYEIVEVSSPYGKTIKCAKRGNILISITKITMFGLGRIQFPKQAELAQLRRERHANQRKFSRNQEKARRLERLERLEYNYRRSQGNLKAVQDVGLNDSDEVVRQLIDHLLTIGQSVSTDGYHTSEIDALLGKLYIQSYWQILSDGRNYLATVIFISKV